MECNEQIKKRFDYVALDMEFYNIDGYELFLNFLEYVKMFNRGTFGNFTLEEKANSLVKHIRSECDEIEENPTDLGEWIDVVILAIS